MSERQILRVRRRLAAPSPLPERSPSLYRMPPEVDVLCHQWAHWVATRRFYGPSPKLISVLGRLRTSRATAVEVPPIVAGRLLPHFHVAVLGLPERERIVLELHYIHRAKPQKVIAAALGCCREHLYRLRAAGATQAYRRAQEMQEANRG